MLQIKAKDRHNTDCIKWDTVVSNNYPSDTLCMWVADLEFETSAEIQNAILRRAQHPIYGYSKIPDDYFEVVCKWMERRYGSKVDPGWIVTAPGNVSAIKMAIQAFTNSGDAVLVQTPVYYQFMNAITTNNRVVVSSPLQLINGKYEIDIANFESAIVSNNVKMFILCNPHNPVCKAYTENEIRQMADICLRHQVMIISDEVHADFVFSPHKFISFLTLEEKYLQNTIVCTGANKTFNIAGLKNANIVLPNSVLKDRFYRQLVSCGIEKQNLFGSIACRAAYLYGDSYADALVRIIQDNFTYLKQCLEELLPQCSLIEPEATYLAWIDVSALGLSDQELHQFLCYDAHLWVDEGSMFGSEGSGFLRLNIACPREQIRDAVLRIKKASEHKNLLN